MGPGRRYFIAYRHSGEDEGLVRQRTSAVVEALREVGIEAYATLLDQGSFNRRGLSTKDIMRHAFANIDQMDGLFVIVASDDKSEGQLIELGYAIAKGKHIIVAHHQDAHTYTHELADTEFSFTDLDDLRMKISGLVA